MQLNDINKSCTLFVYQIIEEGRPGNKRKNGKRRERKCKGGERRERKCKGGERRGLIITIFTFFYWSFIFS